MTLETKAGPTFSTGQQPAVGQFGPGDYNADAAPDGHWMGDGLVDPRYRISGGGPNLQPGSGPQAILAGLSSGPYYLVDQVPSTAAVNNIAAAANPTSGTPLTLVSSSGAGITVNASAFTVLQTGLVVPSGALAIDGNPAVLDFGQSGAVGIVDPTKALARAVSVTGVASGTGGTVTVKGYDLYGNPQSETITLAAGANTVNGKKAFKWITSATPNFTDTHTVSVGTTDIYGFPFAVDRFAQADIVWNNAFITASTGFVVADRTSPATATTGDVRGTYAVQSASDGTKRLQLEVCLTPAQLLNAAGFNVGLFGVTPA